MGAFIVVLQNARSPFMLKFINQVKMYVIYVNLSNLDR
jgi:hypothetical protein